MKKTKEEMYIGIGLGRLRNEKKWTQEKLAEESKLNTRYIQDLEYNEKSPSGTTLGLLANAFEMKLSEFLKQIEDEIIYKYPEKRLP
ncbi:XRE family transcriptional regulator [Neobacillus bataviensis LMG 21833]|uniref:XRE family transcriptional regulator n=1 Tax=Neobacillus bataviensis LMG 21833 TaxID=1117379 RepID=K6DDQ8_9BACI|nr:helix-turn-helix transcriptional regulator [Neobacillus bataviensis]EKN66444.1 XRE family transcriptional regulator [Neobacillus bataviensis LMG 21833]